MSVTVDVVIIGAGPAGCAAAIRARQANLQVILLEENCTPKIAPGETLHPGIQPLLQQLGVLDQVLAANFPRHSGIWLQQQGNRQFLPYGQDETGSWLGFQVDRKLLQQILQQAAVDTQAILLRDCKPEAVIIENNRVQGVYLNGEALRATWTVDATGRSAWLARQLQLPATLRSPPLRVLFGWRHNTPEDLNNQPLFSFHDKGWDWQAPLQNNKSAWVSLRIGEIGKNQARGLDLTWRYRLSSAGLGYFLLGDAAALLDPSSSHGVLRALMSGILFGFLAETHKHKAIAEERIISTYRQWLVQQFSHNEQHLRQHYTNSPAGKQFTAMALQVAQQP